MNFRYLSFATLMLLAPSAVLPQVMHHHAPAALTPSTFDSQMDAAMSTMHAEMAEAKPTGNPDHDFMTMMIPHHQGAIDMARAVLLASADPKVRNLAEGIIAEQQSEIQLMRRWLDNAEKPAAISK